MALMLAVCPELLQLPYGRRSAYRDEAGRGYERERTVTVRRCVQPLLTFSSLFSGVPL